MSKAFREIYDMAGKIIGYKRVSTEEQNLDRQDLGPCDRIFEEKLSGKNRERPQLQEMMRYIRDDDEVRVYSIDRLGRSLSDLQNLVDEITAKGAKISFIKESISFSSAETNPFAKLQFQMLAMFAEFERNLIKDRQREGIEKAKAKGIYKDRCGRPEVVFDMQRARDLRNLGVPYSKIAKELRVNYKTLFRKMTADKFLELK